MDTLAERFAILEPHMTVYGPDDTTPRPAVVFFHGCGGMRPHVHEYAQAASLVGVRAYVIDSFAARGWDRTFATSLICTGVVMQGYERSGDVLSVLWGLSQSGKVDMDKVILVGFSHGGWSIMDLMTQPLTKSGEAKISDPDPALVDRVAGLFLVYPYISFPARSNGNPWVHKPKTFAVLAARDHLTPIVHSEKIFRNLQKDGVDVTTLKLDATHAFDEHENKGLVMKFDPAMVKQSQEALLSFMGEVFGPTVAPATKA